MYSSLRFWLLSCPLLVSLIAFSGCASIVSGRHAEVAFHTYPAHAHIVIQDHRGRQVSSLDTPGVATLKRQGRFFMPARYTATIMAPGYQTVHVPIGYTLNPWIFGNIVIGGIPGLVVDNATGAAWKPRRAEIHQNLALLDGTPPSSMYSASENRHQETAEVAENTADQSSPANAARTRRQ